MEILIAKINELPISNFDIQKLNEYQKRKSYNPESLSSFYLLEQLLAKRNLNLKDIIYKNGKPIISDYYLSITHKGDYVVVAISKNKIGIDLEQLRDFNVSKILSFFSQTEKSFINQSRNQQLAFYQIFTTKEAISKITGLGLKSFLDFNIVQNNKISYQNYQIKYIYFADYILSIVKEKI